MAPLQYLKNTLYAWYVLGKNNPFFNQLSFLMKNVTQG